MNTQNETAAAESLETFWKCSYGGSSYFSENLDDIAEEIGESEPGEKYTVEKVLMTREKFNALPEFDGF